MDDSLSKGEQTRRDLIDVACDMFLLNGFHATTTRKITEQLDLVPGALYNHFSGKSELFEAVLNTYHPWLRIPDAIRHAEGDTVEEFIRNATNNLLNEWNKKPELVRLHLVEVLEFNGQHIPALFEKTFTQIPQIIVEIQEKNHRLDEINEPLLYRALLGLFFGYLMSDKAIVDKENQFIEGGFDYFADIYLSGLFTQTNKKE
ncbi:MAG: TetR/AcrR family transcriptional regulator [Anaerolineaceae bacterium]|jgi:AcrR family transcriptional regulator|nr:TetR/AcrR family transcriptional regulator [Anaerolineaceae bacterium]